MIIIDERNFISITNSYSVTKTEFAPRRIVTEEQAKFRAYTLILGKQN